MASLVRFDILVVILVGIPPVIIRDVQHPVLWVFVFFSFMVVRKIYKFSWFFESQLCLYFCLQYSSLDVSWRQLSLTAPEVCWIGGTGKRRGSSCSYRKCPQGGSTFPHPNHSSGNQSLRKSWLPRLWIKVQSAWANIQGLKSQYFFPLKLHPFPAD